MAFVLLFPFQELVELGNRVLDIQLYFSQGLAFENSPILNFYVLAILIYF